MNLLLIPYFTFTFMVGWLVLSTWFNDLPKLLSVVGSFLLGIGVSIPVTYMLTVLYSASSDPILYGVITYIILSGFLLFILKHNSLKGKLQSIPLRELLLTILILGFSVWIMFKTFHGDASGQLFVGSNNIFDSAYLVGLVRSMSWGANIPFQSPYFAGLPLFYHFFFLFWAALLEHIGIPIVWAVNIPAIFSFSALLIVVYFLPQLVGKQKPVVGWIAVLLTITNSSLAFWEMVLKNGLSPDLWRMQTYPFAGPFDGSTISIFVTLNNYVNQRHLAFAIAAGLFLYMSCTRFLTDKTMTVKKAIVIGFATGLLLLWNMAIFVLTITVISLLFIINRKWKYLIVCVSGAAVVSIVSVIPMIPFLYRAALFINSFFVSGSYASFHGLPSWNIISYLWQNLGILPLVATAGFLVLPKKTRIPFVPLIVLFIGMCIYASIGKRGFDQKLLSFLIIGVNVLAATAVSYLWRGKRLIAKAGAIVLTGILTVSGFLDLIPIKNEFAYPLIDKNIAVLTKWIASSTPKNSIFVSYSDMIDPVVLAGRTNYFGFYGNVGWYDRSPDVAKIYGGDKLQAVSRGITYVLAPIRQKNDFPYGIDLKALRSIYKIVYEDERVVIFKI